MKTCIITGASRGIGKAIAILLKEKGYNVVGTYLNSKEQALKLQTEYGIDFIRCDVALDSDVARLFDYAIKKYKVIDLVIANAGIALKQAPFFDVTPTDMQKVLNVNLLGVMLVNSYALKNMAFSGGAILNVSSVFGITGGSCEAVYSASKSGVIGFTKSLAEEVENSPLSIAGLTLGLIDTDMNAHLTGDEKLEFVKACGLDKIPTASDVADKVYEIVTSGVENGKIYSAFH